ncbi:hypothetical protein MNEG_15062 [Monoraphidium neglectum]|uniref:Uncharacterized protein n=1 Tax=Monoraphidium neglectum TaxID=145388 RepID=A0A0D2LT21_9CHLO|nr:hypothetical protein MNEG_15062 [Monoraphidium neglectum]KIY92901.1 hypothetical protein MNEG_15062 [Monoraphidium neglectum]|eukprot:XP_013891921.1 hypothetical protein MNEG_15062 [Monoraphidium neglectum]
MALARERAAAAAPPAAAATATATAAGATARAAGLGGARAKGPPGTAAGRQQGQAAGGGEGDAAAQALHNELYCLLADETRAALAALATPLDAAAHASCSSLDSSAQQANGEAARAAARTGGEGDGDGGAASLAELAEDAEAEGDAARAHALHQQRVATAAGGREEVQALCDYGRFCARAGAATRAEECFRRVLEADAAHAGAAAALLCLQLHLARQEARGGSTDGGGGGHGCAAAAARLFEAAEVLGHALQDGAAAAAAAAAAGGATAAAGRGAAAGARQGGGGGGGGSALAWALLSLVYSEQGKPKEQQARSCHQEVVRLSKEALASLRPPGQSQNPEQQQQQQQQAPVSSSDNTPSAPPSQQRAADGTQQGQQPPPPSMGNGPAGPGDVAAASGGCEAAVKEGAGGDAVLSGYLEAAELLLGLGMGALADAALQLGAGLKDGAARLWKRTALAGARAALLLGDGPRALSLLRGLQVAMAEAGDDGVCALVATGDAHYEGGNFTLAKQSYRRAASRAPGACPPCALARLADCFLRSGDAAYAADTFELAAAARPAAAAWLGAAAARARLRDYEAADAALARASRRDPRHPGVWGRLALLALEQGREDEAGQP